MNLIEPLHEKLAVLGVHDGLDGCAEHAHVVFLKHSALVELHATVERGLPSKGEEDAVGLLLLDDPLHEIRLYGKEIYLVGHALRSLHGGNIGVDENRLYALLTQSLQSLRAGIVEFAGLSNLQGARTQQQYLFNIMFFHLG